MVTTRFAPSPTGYLHIGSARTALFNYLFAKRHKGKFLLRIEDTDEKRHSKEALKDILEGLKWLGIVHDADIVFQSLRKNRHKDVAHELVSQGKAYYCFTSQEEIDLLRNKAINNKEPFIFKSPWRDRNIEQNDLRLKKGTNPVVRLKVSRKGTMTVQDLVQGEVKIDMNTLDDMVLLRGDQSPTYMLAAVVDDIDMGITHIIRGDDHLTNTARQKAIYRPLDAKFPITAHIPLIYDEKGFKLSKRTGAIGVTSYKEYGYLPQALCSYLLRLGWSYGSDEIISINQAKSIFSLEGLVKSPARVDYKKMNHVNSFYIKNLKNEDIKKIIQEKMHLKLEELGNIDLAIESIKNRSVLTCDLVKLAKIYTLNFEINPREILEKLDLQIIKKVRDAVMNLEDFSKKNIEDNLKRLAHCQGIKVGSMMRDVRLALTGMEDSPSVFELISIIGKEEFGSRIENVLQLK